MIEQLGKKRKSGHTQWQDYIPENKNKNCWYAKDWYKQASAMEESFNELYIYYSEQEEIPYEPIIIYYPVKREEEKSIDKIAHIKHAIKEAGYIKDLEESWDDEGALKVPLHVWERAMLHLQNYARYIEKNHSTVITAPEIDPGRDGSIDLSWRLPKATLLINFKNSEAYLASYYGDDGNNNQIIEGKLNDIKINEDLAFWMRKLSA